MYKKVILVHDKKLDKHKVYSSLVGFQEWHPEYSIHTLQHYLTKKKAPFEDDKFKVSRVEFVQRE